MRNSIYISLIITFIFCNSYIDNFNSNLYNNQTILSYDPLFRCKHIKWIITEDKSLRRVIESINYVSEAEYLYQVELFM